MSAADLPRRERVSAHIAGLYSALGIEYDKFRPIWGGASHGDRVLMLAFAGEKSHSYARREWDQLPADLRGRIRAGFQRFKGWADRVAGNA